MQIIPDIQKPVKKPLTIRFEPEELEFLAVVMSKISGHEFDSSRKHADSLSRVLRSEGYHFTELGLYPYVTGSLHLNDIIKPKKD